MPPGLEVLPFLALGVALGRSTQLLGKHLPGLDLLAEQELQMPATSSAESSLHIEIQSILLASSRQTSPCPLVFFFSTPIFYPISTKHLFPSVSHHHSESLLVLVCVSAPGVR